MSNNNFKLKTRANKGSSKVIFSGILEDFNKYFEDITNEILDIQSCSIYHLDNQDIYPDDKEEYESLLKDTNLFVFPISYKFLTTDNRAKDIDFKYAIDNHIPVLPIVIEPHQLELFNLKMGNIQAIDRTSTDSTQESYKDKLEKAIKSILLDDETIQKIKDAFDAYIFLSYRKKDRIHAQEIMSLIHKNDFMRDIAIWYDENLTPGEDFNNQIEAILHKSDLFALVVTPNINEKDNYVLVNEFPKALNDNKPILPIEAIDTDKDEFKRNYNNNTPINKHNTEELNSRLKDILFKEGIKENNDPEHLYFIGLAYLNAIDVERNVPVALDLLERSAFDNYLPALKELVDIYQNGRHTNVNYPKAIEYQCRIIEKDKKSIISYDKLATLYIENNNIDSAIEIYNTCRKLTNNRNLLIEFEIKIAECYKTQTKLIESLRKYIYLYKALTNEFNNNKLIQTKTKLIIKISELCNELGNKELAFKLATYVYNKKTSAEDRIDILSIMGNVLYDLGLLNLALFVYEEKNKIIENIYGTDSKNHLTSKTDIARYKYALGNLKECLKILEDIWKKSCELYGTKHPYTMKILSEYALICSNAGENAKAEVLYDLLYKYRSEVYGEKHPTTIDTLNNISIIYYSQQNYDKAIENEKKCYEQRKQFYGINHDKTVDAMQNLGLYYFKNNEVDKAIKLEQDSYELRFKKYGSHHKKTEEILENLMDMYKITNNETELKKCQKKLSSANVFDQETKNTDSIFTLCKEIIQEVEDKNECVFYMNCPVYRNRKSSKSKDIDLLRKISDLLISLFTYPKVSTIPYYSDQNMNLFNVHHENFIPKKINYTEFKQRVFDEYKKVFNKDIEKVYGKDDNSELESPSDFEVEYFDGKEMIHINYDEAQLIELGCEEIRKYYLEKNKQLYEAYMLEKKHHYMVI